MAVTRMRRIGESMCSVQSLHVHWQESDMRILCCTLSRKYLSTCPEIPVFAGSCRGTFILPPALLYGGTTPFCFKLAGSLLDYGEPAVVIGCNCVAKTYGQCQLMKAASCIASWKRHGLVC